MIKIYKEKKETKTNNLIKYLYKITYDKLTCIRSTVRNAAKLAVNVASINTTKSQ